MRLVSFLSDGGARTGLLDGELIHELPGRVIDHLLSWPSAGTRTRPLAGTRLLAPLGEPPAIYCAAANYSDHQKEMSGREPPDKATVLPHFFLKASRCVIGPDDVIVAPRAETRLDWEAEIVAVIGQGGRHIKAEQAMEHVAGYTIINDVSAREQIRRPGWQFSHDWFGGKTFDTSAPMGPYVTQAKEIHDPHRLAIRTWINDELAQDSNSSYMHYTIPEQIAYLSTQVTLRTGDAIATGTPSGVGAARGRSLQPGDRIRIEIEGLGELRNVVG